MGRGRGCGSFKMHAHGLMHSDGACALLLPVWRQQTYLESALCSMSAVNTNPSCFGRMKFSNINYSAILVSCMLRILAATVSILHVHLRPMRAVYMWPPVHWAVHSNGQQ